MKNFEINKVQRGNPAQPNEEKQWYPVIKHKGRIARKEMLEFLSKNTRFGQGDLISLFCDLVDLLPYLLVRGYSLELPHLGTLRLTVRGEGSDTPEQCTAKKIKQFRVVFQPSREFKRRIEDAK